MRKLLNVLILIGVLSSIGGCTYKKPTLVDFIGIWKSSTGGEIVLQEDSICVIKNIIYSGYLCTEMLSYKGKWEFRDKDDLGNKQYNIIISKKAYFLCAFTFQEKDYLTILLLGIYFNILVILTNSIYINLLS